MNERIFVSIASYRDPQLLPTIKNMLRMADNPDLLKICVAWQHSRQDEWDGLEEYVNDKRFEILDIPAEESKGVCWARSLIQKKWHNEGYYLQIDSHMRFTKGWDTKLKGIFQLCLDGGFKKPILTSYVPSYNPENDPGDRRREVWRMNFDRFTPEGIVFMRPAVVKNSERKLMPWPTQFFSAHFTFTLGKFAREVPYDPNLYFHGEEITMAVRAFTHGYDLFTPHQTVAWHEYTRKGRTRVWDDDKDWVEKNESSLERTRAILGVDGTEPIELGKYGFGKERTKEEYEKYAGIRFKDRAVQQYTLNHLDPPNPVYSNQEWYEKSWRNVFRHCLNVPKSQLGNTPWDAYAIVFEDDRGEPLHRQDAGLQEIQNAWQENADKNYIHIWREYDTKNIPHHAVVWPYRKGGEWGNHIVIDIKKKGP